MIKLLLNPNSSPTNFVKIARDEAGCCDGNLQDCKYVGTFKLPVTQVNFTDQNGEAVSVVFDSPATTTAEVLAVLEKTITTPQMDGGLGAYVDGAGIQIEDLGGGDYKMTAESQLPFVSIIGNGATTTFTPYCEKKLFCACTVFGLHGSDVELSYDGGAAQTATMPAAGAVAAAKTAFETAFGNLFSSTETVSVEEDTNIGGYIAVIKIDGTCDKLDFNGKTATSCVCEGEFVDASGALPKQK